MLLETPGIGPKSLGAILRKNAILRRTPRDFLGLSVAALRQEYGIRREPAQRLLQEAAQRYEQAAALNRDLARNGVSVVTLIDATYPSTLLERLDEPPPALYAYGDLSVLNQRLFVIANSNGAPEEALAAADRIAEIRAEDGWVLVTGHNRPGYQRPALAVRRNGGRTVYVLDRGLLHGFGGDLNRALFPAARIWGPAFDPQCDLAISPFPLRAQGIAVNNRRRDTVIFALAERIYVGWVREDGQMEGQCLGALQRGQEVFLLPVPQFEKRNLLAAGARSLDGSDAGDATARHVASIGTSECSGL